MIGETTPREGTGSPPDWSHELQRHRRWLRTVVSSRLGEADGIDDVLQEIGLAAARADLRPDREEKVAPWLYRVAVKQCLARRRSAGRRRKFLDKLVRTKRTHEASVDPLEWLIREERQEHIREAFARLPDLDRQVLLLKYTEHWTYQDLATRLGVSVDTIEYRLLRARKRLRRLLAEREKNDDERA